MIESTHVLSATNAWYYSHLGSLDFARQMGLISEERRQELYHEFSRAIDLITEQWNDVDGVKLNVRIYSRRSLET